ncbi:Dolichyl-phosphate-mannose-protein mannosyltransferase [uncultured Desulfobacterium sp.]|uniref:Dolichyl-phosphate-mannose-protein mannosyltransferase n=1 Tax=uncultured Desulfobacterium sp. TaxID=201089 RepID=A0A445MWW8_9BACT|nr:Dolichyl-phosphate-mannose-protein mannosyltransferase [uncultured Desulfobacterium sp.]
MTSNLFIPANCRWATGICFILLLAVLMYFGFLGEYPLADPDEGRYAEIAREMLESGDFVTPHLNYVKYLEKPPLFYWLVAASIALLGEKELAVRAVPAVAGLLSVLLVISLGRRVLGRRIGLTAGWIYLTSLEPFVLARLPIIDMVFSLCLTATWGAWWLGYTTEAATTARRWYTLAWACLGLATMAKGLAAIVLTVVILLLFLSALRNLDAMGRMAWWPGPVIFAVIVAPWHFLVVQRNPEFWHFYIVVQHFARLSGEEHLKPFWFFPATLPLGMMFWGAFLFPVMVHAIRSGLDILKSPLTVSARTRENRQNPALSDQLADKRQSQAILFLVIWVIAVVGLFSLSKCKLLPYILPSYPALAILTARHFNGKELFGPATGWCLAITVVCIVGLIISLPYAARYQDTVPFSKIEALVFLNQCLLSAGCGLVILSIFRRRLALVSVGLILVLIMPTLGKSAGLITTHRKVSGLVKAMPDPLPADIKIAEWHTYDQSLSFYTRRRIILVDEVGELAHSDTSKDHTLFFLKGEDSLRSLASDGPLLVNMSHKYWSRIKKWGILFPVAANRTNLMVANKEFFSRTALEPWPEEALTSPPLLLLPRKARKG